LKTLRSALGVILGYVLFAVAAVGFFRVLGQNPHQSAPFWLMVCSTLYGSAAAFLGAKIAARVAGYKPFAHGVALGVVIAVGATLSLVSTAGHGAIWSQITALLFMAPSASLAGWHGSRSAIPV
jgi:uncharacterized membrane protein YgaE (UPF0421/DUF939 family)